MTFTKVIIALIAGALFGIGLTVSQMVDPNKVLNFLDISGNWDPSLLFVMAAALLVFGLTFWLVIKNRQISLTGNPISLSKNQIIDKKLIVGACLFGIGWGMSGICPGPAIANISGMEPKIGVFILVMFLGMKVSELAKTKIAH